jgi:hypothetical protein
MAVTVFLCCEIDPKPPERPRESIPGPTLITVNNIEVDVTNITEEQFLTLF